METVATGLTRPLAITSPPGDAGRLFVVGQDGRIQIIEDGVVLPEPFLDLRGRTQAENELGLLGLAFHPDFAQNGTFFVNYTDSDEDNVISRWWVSADPDRADIESEELILRIEQPTIIHNAGQLVFGPDGYLYIGVGDGGIGAGWADDLAVLFGKILRIDVDAVRPYGIPADNPFVHREGARPEIWSYGFRNPWRFTFDRLTGDMYVGDVGQSRREEINVQPSGCGGLNFGWGQLEGTLCFLEPVCSQDGSVPPAVEYDRTGLGGSVTGGYVYRGCALPGLRGTYVYADFAQGFVRSFQYVDGAVVNEIDWTAELAPSGRSIVGQISSFGEDADGELYFCDLAGTVYKLVADDP